MAEEKSETSTRPFQLRPSILSSGFGNPFANAAASTEKKGFVLRPSALTSAAEQLETIQKDARKRPVDSTESPVVPEDAKKSKISEELPTPNKETNPTEDIKKPTGIGTFGFASKNDATNSSNADNQTKSKTNYFQQGLNSTNNSEKITFGFGNTTKSTFSSINKTTDDRKENSTEVSTDDNTSSTNGDVTKVKLLENAEEYLKSHNKKTQYKEVEQFTGEEGEQHVLQVICKLHLFDNENKRWLEKGRGTLKLNDICQSEGVFQSRIVFRTQGTNLVFLNTKLWAEMCCEKVKEKSIRITALDPDTKEVKVYLISGGIKDILQTYTAIDRRIEALKRNKISKQEEKKKIKKSSYATDDDDDDEDDDDDDASSTEVATRPRSNTILSSNNITTSDSKQS